MKPEISKYLHDILVSINSIYDYLGQNRDFKAYHENKLLRRAIERELEIIGEASAALLKIDPNVPIDNARKIVDLRNWVIHGYDSVDDMIIWGVVINHLPNLKEQVKKILEK